MLFAKWRLFVSASVCYIIETEWRIYASVIWPSLDQIIGLSPGRRQALSEPMLEHSETNFSDLFYRNSNIFVQANVFESVVYDMTSILSRCQRVKGRYQLTSLEAHTRNKDSLNRNCFSNTRLRGNKIEYLLTLYRGLLYCIIYALNPMFSYLIFITLQWRHSGRDGVSNHQPHDCLLNRIIMHQTKKT